MQLLFLIRSSRCARAHARVNYSRAKDKSFFNGADILDHEETPSRLAVAAARADFFNGSVSRVTGISISSSAHARLININASTAHRY